MSTRISVVAVMLCAGLLLAVACGSEPAETPVAAAPMETPKATDTVRPSPSPTGSATATPSESATPKPTPSPADTATPTHTSTPPATSEPTFTASPTATHTPKPTRKPTATATPNLYQFNGYWLSPIETGTGAYVQTYGNVCPEYLDGSDPYCIENWMGEKGRWPDDYWEILVSPHHVVEWDIAWDQWGEKVFAVQGGQVLDVELEDNSTTGVHFFIVDKKPDNWYGANYGHVNVHSLVDNGIISEAQLARVLAGKKANGAMVREGQLLGVTGDDCCPGGGILHIGPVFGGFWGENAAGEFYYTEPSELWSLGEWPDFADNRPPEAGMP